MLGIIGGTGFYKLDGVNVTGDETVDTPFGTPSAPITRARYKDTELVFLPRHGIHHSVLPHEINYRANIYALKKSVSRKLFPSRRWAVCVRKLRRGIWLCPINISIALWGRA
jgi:5'-methylthioadenosine phosphorylase